MFGLDRCFCSRSGTLHSAGRFYVTTRNVQTPQLFVRRKQSNCHLTQTFGAKVDYSHVLIPFQCTTLGIDVPSCTKQWTTYTCTWGVASSNLVQVTGYSVGELCVFPPASPGEIIWQQLHYHLLPNPSLLDMYCRLPCILKGIFKLLSNLRNISFVPCTLYLLHTVECTSWHLYRWPVAL
jgi:hypothetical protein